MNKKKTMYQALLTALFVSTVIFITSCASTPSASKDTEEKNTEISSKKESTSETHKETKQKTEVQLPVVKEIPNIKFTSNSTQIIEIEEMYTEDFSFEKDEECSGKFAGILKSSVSTAKALVTLPTGNYEILAKEKASDNDHAAFYLFVENEPYRLAPSDPPLGGWELTTRFPITFSIENERPVLLTIQANSPKKAGNTGMKLDYIQIRKF